MGLFRPAWDSKNEKRAVKAVEEINDKALLVRIVKEARCSEARIAAIKKLTKIVFADRAKNDEHEHVRVVDVENDWCVEIRSDGEGGRLRIADIKRVRDVVPCDETTKPIGVTQDGVSLIEPEMVFVQGGTFTMGGTAEQGNDCYDWEKPAHLVTLSDYYIGKYEVTQAQWRAIMGENPSYFKGDNLPVEHVNRDDVKKFITKLNRMTGKQYRLPTEAEWEYVARGGNRSQGYKYSGSNHVDDVAWYMDNSGMRTHAIGTKSPNELGIYDMSGNVWELCSDWYDAYSDNAQTNPQGPSFGSKCVLRGGSCFRDARNVRVSIRLIDYPDFKSFDLGFRLALSSK